MVLLVSLKLTKRIESKNVRQCFRNICFSAGTRLNWLPLLDLPKFILVRATNPISFIASLYWLTDKSFILWRLQQGILQICTHLFLCRETAPTVIFFLLFSSGQCSITKIRNEHSLLALGPKAKILMNQHMIRLCLGFRPWRIYHWTIRLVKRDSVQSEAMRFEKCKTCV